jgi:GLPGLI family protein
MNTLLQPIKFGLLALISFILLTSGGEIPTGYIKYKRTQNWTKMYASLDFVSEQQKEKDAYVWGKRSEWSSYCELYFDAKKSIYVDSDEPVDASQTWSYQKPAYVITRDFEKRRRLDHIETLGKTYIVEDTLLGQNWKILNNLKEVAGHICMSAVWYDSIKYQRVEAWFALDIPIASGPEMFGGLPGLILEININNGALVIEPVVIEMKNVAEELNKVRKMKGKKINASQYNTLMSKYIQERKKLEEPYFWGLRY